LLVVTHTLIVEKLQKYKNYGYIHGIKHILNSGSCF